jgi:hypothetical protein
LYLLTNILMRTAILAGFSEKEKSWNEMIFHPSPF